MFNSTVHTANGLVRDYETCTYTKLWVFSSERLWKARCESFTVSQQFALMKCLARNKFEIDFSYLFACAPIQVEKQLFGE